MAGPTYAHVYVENRCHLKCDHCYESPETHPPVRGLSLEQYDELFADLARLGVFVVTFSGGEPMLRKDFLDIVALARQHRFAVRIYTSGTLIDEAVADRLAELKVHEVHVSVYSPYAEVHDAFTKRDGSHAKSMRGLRLLKARGIRTIFKSCVMTINVDDLHELKALALSVGAVPRFDPGIKPRMNGDTSPLKYALTPELVAEKFLDVPDLVDTWGDSDPDHLCDGENPRRGKDYAMCAAATQLIAINADGTVSPCAMFPRNAGAYTEGVGNLWRDSPLFNQVRGQRFDDMSSCTSCEVQSGCDPCMAYGIVEHGDQAACNSASKLNASGLHHLKLRKARSLPIVQDAPSALTAV
jgi:radical SAM protein with 4Fe4S-binding SPASM domain